MATLLWACPAAKPGGRERGTASRPPCGNITERYATLSNSRRFPPATTSALKEIRDAPSLRDRARRDSPGRRPQASRPFGGSSEVGQGPPHQPGRGGTP